MKVACHEWVLVIAASPKLTAETLYTEVWQCWLCHKRAYFKRVAGREPEE